MELLESYRELIESDVEDISICWKLFQILFYLLSATAGYGSAILFYIFWYEIFAGNCPLWANVVLPLQPRVIDQEEEDAMKELVPSVQQDWQQKVIIAFKYTGRCKLYHLVSLCSCVFGVAWLMLFAMCGKGGYDTRIFSTPWSVVPPALVFQFIFAILTMFVVYDMEYGYHQFASRLEQIVFQVNDTETLLPLRQCNIVQQYLEVYGANRYSVCHVYPILRILSWLMAWSWVLGLTVLILRVINVNDFKLLTVKIYKIPKDQAKKYTLKRNSSESAETAESVRIPKKRKRLTSVCCCVQGIKDD